MTGFKLLRLAALPLIAVLKQMDYLELIRLSSCHKTLRYFVGSVKDLDCPNKLSYKELFGINCIELHELFQIKDVKNAQDFIQLNNWKLEIDVSTHMSVDICAKNTRLFWGFRVAETKEKERIECWKTETVLKLGSLSVPAVIDHARLIVTYWENRTEGLKTLISYFMDHFKLEIYKFETYGSDQKTYSGELREVIDWMNNVQKNIALCLIKWDKYNGTNDDFSFILDNVKPTRGYNLLIKDLIKYTGNFNSSYIWVEPSHWFTLNNLLSTNCETIVLCDTSLTDAELHIFLTKWMEGGFKNLKHLFVQKPDLDICVVIGDLPVTQVLNRGGKIYKCFEGGVSSLFQAKDIHRSDGVVASIKFPHQDAHKLTAFEFVVWPDFEGNNV